MLKIAVLPGDGIGVDVTYAALPIFKALQIPVTLETGEIGWECWKKYGNPVPQKTWDLIESSDAVLLGAITSKPQREAEEELESKLQGTGLRYVSPVIQLRQRLGLFANTRPVRNINVRAKPFCFTVIRENTEGLYAGLDYAKVPAEFKTSFKEKRPPYSSWKEEDLNSAVCSVRLLTERGLRRLFEFAFHYTKENGFLKLTFADKPNVLRESSNFARKIFEDVSAKYSFIVSDIQNVDAVALQMVRKPENYGVIVAENMFGDILSDLGGGIMGGLGLAPSANFGQGISYFEPVHGSAPKYSGLNKANPTAMFLTIALLLEHKGFKKEAALITKAVDSVIKEAKVTTFDLGGSASTQEMAEAIIQKCLSGESTRKTVAILSTGSELTNGEVANSNAQKISDLLKTEGISVRQHIVVDDSEADIRRSILTALTTSDALLITGGLGPTSDDRTRFALANTLDLKLHFSETAWEHVQKRLKSFGIPIDESNRQQALFPLGAEELKNENGTAYGAFLEAWGKQVFMLPGPPRECIPMVEKSVLPILRSKNYAQEDRWVCFKVLGAIEGDIASKTDKLIFPNEAAYRWNYPYLDVKMPATAVTDEVKRFLLSEYDVLENRKTASENLLLHLKKNPSLKLRIDDHSTGGLLQSLLLYSETRKQLNFNQRKTEDSAELHFTIEGLLEYWSVQNPQFSGKTSVRIKGETFFLKETFIPFRGPEVRLFAAEWACFQILKIMGE